MLALPRFAVVWNETIAQKGLPHGLDVCGLVEVLPMGDVDGLDQRRITGEHQITMEGASDEGVAMFGMPLDQELPSVPDHVEQGAPKPMAPSSWQLLAGGGWLFELRRGLADAHLSRTLADWRLD